MLNAYLPTKRRSASGRRLVMFELARLHEAQALGLWPERQDVSDGPEARRLQGLDAQDVRGDIVVAVEVCALIPMLRQNVIALATSG